ncbi:MAG: hypothetical protein ACYDH6_24555 [Acidimicrobiales bacterium]
MQLHPVPAPDDLVDAWRAAVGDAGITLGEVGLIWRKGRPRPTGQEAASWRADSDIDAEFDDDYEFTPALRWANSDRIRGLPRVMVWVGRTPEGLAGLLRHELEHTVQVAAHVELDHLHQRAFDEVRKRGGTGRSYNAIPMEVDANRAAARFLRCRYGSDRLRQLVDAGDVDAACFRPTADPDGLDTLTERMRLFILRVTHDDDFVGQLESDPPAI